MSNNDKFKQDLEDFIRNRIEECYTTMSNQAMYKKLINKYKDLENKFIKNLPNSEAEEQYYIIRDIRMELDYQELQQTYLIGFIDNNKIINNKF